jgi:uncharacterized membrane protein
METQHQYSEQRRSQNHVNNRKENRIANGLGWFSIGLGLAEIVAPRKVANLIGVSDEGRTRKVLRMYGMRVVAAGLGILSQDNPSGWLWARVGGDLLDLSSLGKAMASSGTERSRAGVTTAAVAGITALDIYCAQRFSAESGRNGSSRSDSADIVSSIIIDRSPEEIYRFWRDFAHLPQIFRQLDSVQVTGEKRSHWKMHAPIGRKAVEWDAEITEDQPNSHIAWRSVSSTVPHSGSIRFSRATGGRGTKVDVRIELGGLPGKLGKLVGIVPEQQVKIALHNLKQLLETGEVVQSDASVHEGMHPGRPPENYQPQIQAAGATASM